MMLNQLGPRPAAVRLLGAQAITHGLLCILTIVPAAGLFLSNYGAKRLPFVYIAVGVIGISTAPLLARALGRWPIAVVARPVLFGLSAVHLVCWTAIERWGVRWPAIVIQVVLPITLQLGFVFLGGQAGQILTMREMKSWFSLIAAGFSVALLVGGFLAPFVVELLGATHHLLALTSLSALLLALLVTLTHRRFLDTASASVPVASSVDPSKRPEPSQPAGPPARRFVALIFAYQVCSSLGTQFGEFFIFDRAAARYSTAEELARFASHFNVALNIVELIFLALVAGPLMQRFGLRFGLAANPVVLLSGFVVAAVLGPVAGVGSFAMLIAASAARTGDITLTNSTTRTATNTAYQALPSAVRPAVQARTEGVAVPMAIGLSGAMLLVIDWLGGEVYATIGVSIGICFVWLGVTGALFNRYRKQLHDVLSHRVMSRPATSYAALSPQPSPAVDISGVHAEWRLSASPSPAEVRLLARHMRNANFQPDEMGDHIEQLLVVSEATPRLIAILARKKLSRLLPEQDLRRPLLAASGIEAAVRHANEVTSALRAVPVSDFAMALRQALLDSAREAQALVLASLSVTLHHDAMARAALWLDGSEHERAIAIESIEVNAPREHRASILAVLAMHSDLEEAERRLRDAGATVPKVDDWLIDLRDDPRAVWKDRWLSICAERAIQREIKR